ncbi:hypothetical protein CC80DRAFT_487726 [Byssothecium circinans]|uniref:Uncharacterized protein n=1 Tax=Byssothecium circinans TaxID=147558 RepID=A0A6A5UE27_9PLEO|nr:hypothetical protein CC80DRAFT_487726 [Byssothecium circinans]
MQISPAIPCVSTRGLDSMSMHPAFVCISRAIEKVYPVGSVAATGTHVPARVLRVCTRASGFIAANGLSWTTDRGKVVDVEVPR